MSMIRIGLVGVPKTANFTNGWALKSHLPAIQASPHYEIVAVCNSTKISAQASIDTHNLGPNVRAYGSPEDLANDANVDLVVVVVKLANHYPIAKAALSAEKDVFVEWPLALNSTEAEELVALAKTNGNKTIVGLQTIGDPLVIKLKEIVESGKIGKVHSTIVKGAFAYVSAQMWPLIAKGFLELESGGTIFQIILGHYLAAFTKVLGPFHDLTSIFRTLKPTTNIIDETGNVVELNFIKTATDHVFIQGVLESAAVATINFRATDKSIDGSGSTPWHLGGSATFKMFCEDGGIEKVDFEDKKGPDYVASVEAPATNTAYIYNAFATSAVGRYATFEDALVHHRLLDTILEKSKYI